MSSTTYLEGGKSEMAQHYPLKEKDEPEVFKSIRRIAGYVTKSWNWWGLERTGPDYVYRKKVVALPKEYNPEGKTFAVGPYNLKDKKWDERRNYGVDFRKGAHLEVHTDLHGNIQAVYYPL